MYRRRAENQLELPNFYLPFSGHLDPENRWVLLARLVPWKLAEEIYVEELCEDFGADAKEARVALGALLIKERMGLTDRATVDAIQENPYLQYFIGLEEFTLDPPFHPSMMVHFRKRFGESGLARINEALVMESLGQTCSETAQGDAANDDSDDRHDTHGGSLGSSSNGPLASETAAKSSTTAEAANQGKLLMDATCAPADIRYPTDVSVLNEAREKADEIIDEMHRPFIGKRRRPRTYRVKARKAFVGFSRRKKPSKRKIRRAVGQQLRYLRRNLKFIDRFIQQDNRLICLSRRQYKNLLVIGEVYRQQLEMYHTRTHRISDRIVSLSQPHVRPIKRGKVDRPTEFGAKISVSLVEGFAFLDHLRWNNFNESQDFVGQLESFHTRFGHYPESVHVDQIYRTRANRAYCKEHGIRISGPPLGRPKQDVSRQEKRQARADQVIRNGIEGKFGQGKRRFGLGRVMAKLADTSAAQIMLSFLSMNLERALAVFFFVVFFLCQNQRNHPTRLQHPSQRQQVSRFCRA
jgi:hypothetical protein